MWDAAFVGMLVNFAVWASRPTGKIDREMAIWLITVLGASAGPTHNCVKASFEMVREAPAGGRGAHRLRFERRAQKVGGEWQSVSSFRPLT